MDFQLADDDVDFIDLLGYHETWVREASAPILQYSEADPLDDLRAFALHAVEVCHDRKFISFQDADHTIVKYTKKGGIQFPIRLIRANWTSRRVPIGQKHSWVRPTQFVVLLLLLGSAAFVLSVPPTPQTALLVGAVIALGFVSILTALVSKALPRARR